MFSSQPVLAPTNVQLSFSKTSSIDDCSYKADVTISWDHPDYDIKNEPQTMYIIEGKQQQQQIYTQCGTN